MIDKQINFPNVKINLGLNILAKRDDGFHNLQTIFYPINFTDALEIMPANDFSFKNHGIIVDCPIEKNLCYKAYELLRNDFDLPAVKFILYKNVPFGSGLGAGSSDAAFTIKMLNDMFGLNLAETVLLDYARKLGADCAFFIKNKPVYAEGRGDVFSEINISLNGKILVLVLPNISVNTALAYKNCHPKMPKISLFEAINQPLEVWKNVVKNDFEEVIFPMFPQLPKIKDYLYESGAIFALMSGSGSAMYAIFDNVPADLYLPNCKFYTIML